MGGYSEEGGKMPDQRAVVLIDPLYPQVEDKTDIGLPDPSATASP